MAIVSEISSLWVAQIASLLFFGVLFCQSGIDKVTDWSGNLAWLKGHFEKSPFRSQVPLLLGVITVLEVLTGLICFAGAILTVLRHTHSATISVIALALSALSLLFLFIGQRIAKDYPGASTLAIYFGVALIALSLYAK